MIIKFVDYCLYCREWDMKLVFRKFYTFSLSYLYKLHVLFWVERSQSAVGLCTCSMSWMETPMAVERRRCLLQMCGLMLESTAGTVSGFTARNTRSDCFTTDMLSLDTWAPNICVSSNDLSYSVTHLRLNIHLVCTVHFTVFVVWMCSSFLT